MNVIFLRIVLICGLCSLLSILEQSRAQFICICTLNNVDKLKRLWRQINFSIYCLNHVKFVEHFKNPVIVAQPQLAWPSTQSRPGPDVPGPPCVQQLRGGEAGWGLQRARWVLNTESKYTIRSIVCKASCHPVTWVTWVIWVIWVNQSTLIILTCPQTNYNWLTD